MIAASPLYLGALPSSTCPPKTILPGHQILCKRFPPTSRAGMVWRSALAVLGELLLRRIGDGPLASPEVAQPWRAMLAGCGTAAVPELAREAGWSSSSGEASR